MNRIKGTIIYGIIAICICYIYFLIFAQFSFLELVKANLGSESINTVMGIMGLSGISFSIISIKLLKFYRSNLLLKLGFLCCSISSLLAIEFHSALLFYASSFLIGSALAILTVSLASILRELFPLQKLGLFSGIGTGLAYFVCNIPTLFQANSMQRSLFSALICLAMVLIPTPIMQENKEENDVKMLMSVKSYSTPLLMLLAFTALVWFDSAAFYIIQQSPSYRNITWNGSYHLFTNGFIHLVVAILAGFFIDKKKIVNCLLAAHILLTLGIISLNNLIFASEFASFFYCAGVSIYSTALVLAPSLYFDNKFSLTLRHRAGILYGVAGWFGSAMGIGMAQDLNRVPVLFIIISAIFLLAFKYHSTRKTFSHLAIVAFILIRNEAKADFESIANGREVYISEGCINCHSQFVRPIKSDIELWGPYIDYVSLLKEIPPLIGNRRQGPDLLNVGQRRNREWLKLHFISPRDLLPWSRMPSYGYLFKDNRGENLLDYVQSLGKETLTTRLEFIKSWKPSARNKTANIQIENLYQSHCSQCHGLHGAGDGILASTLIVRPRPLNKRPYIYIDFNRENSIEDLSRLIKFGILGTTMAGHEYLSDDELIGLSEYLGNLSK